LVTLAKNESRGWLKSGELYGIVLVSLCSRKVLWYHV